MWAGNYLVNWARLLNIGLGCELDRINNSLPNLINECGLELTIMNSGFSGNNLGKRHHSEVETVGLVLGLSELMSRPQTTQSAAASALQVKLKPPPPTSRHSGGSLMDGLTDSQLNTIPNTKRNEEEDGNSENDVPKKRVKVKNGRPCLHYLRRRKRLNFLKTNINSLPDEVVFDILVSLPAQDIYGAVRTVCLKWYQMINTHMFVNTHLNRSTYGLLIQSRGSRATQLTFMALSRQGQIELTRLNYVPGFKIWCNSCNGLILESTPNDFCTLCITNPATMQHFALPPFFGSSMAFNLSVITYSSLSMEYKVIKLYRQENQYCCAILTAGVDESWRLVQTQHLSLESKKLLLFKPFTTEGFVHWAGWGNYVLTLNVETEIITEYFVPCLSSGVGFSYNCFYFSTAKYLSLLIFCREWSWEVWEMKPETGEWTKLPGIELNDRTCEILGWLGERDSIFKSAGYCSISLRAVGWLEYKEVIVYHVYGPPLSLDPRFYTASRFCIAWNVRSKEIEFIELDSNENAFFVHRNSLLWLH